ncbi:MAG: hypothetical protein ACI9XK_004182, partial [Granulosicoccus sp.]
MQKYFTSRNPLTLCMLGLLALGMVGCGGGSNNSDSPVSTEPPGADDAPIVEQATFNNA